MAKFKVGDRVIRIKGDFGIAEEGKEYEVTFASQEPFRGIKIKGDTHYSYSADSFDLAPSDLPTDRPLTYDETQMLQAGDVVKSYYGENLIIKTVLCSGITFKNETREWWLDKKEKDTSGDIYFVSHGKEESKEEKKEEVARSRYDMPPVTQEGLEKAIKEIRKKEPILEFAMGERKMWRCDFAKEYDVKPVLKSVSQILYGRR
jgi:hypothetical protein